MLKQFRAFVMTLTVLCFSMVSVSATSVEDSTESICHVEASLSCYINAMGGVEFGAPLLQSATAKMSEDGSGMLTIRLGKSQVEIYSVECNTFIDIAPSISSENNSVTNGTLGYYTEDGVLDTDNISYTLSSETAKNARDEDVHYVDSITFPVNKNIETYYLTLYINSNVMGTQFTKDTYPATVTVNWDSLSSSSNSIPMTSKNPQETTNPSLTPDSMDGLNIYPADEKTAAVNTTPSYTVYLNEQLLLIFIGAAVAITVIGVVIVAWREKNEK